MSLCIYVTLIFMQTRRNEKYNAKMSIVAMTTYRKVGRERLLQRQAKAEQQQSTGTGHLLFCSCLNASEMRVRRLVNGPTNQPAIYSHMYAYSYECLNY